MAISSTRFGATPKPINSAKPDYPEEDISQFGEGLSAGYETTIGTIQGVRSLFNTLTGDDEEAEKYMLYAQERFQAAGESGGTVTSYDQIDGLEDAARWASYSIGTVLPSIAASVVSGGVVGGAASILGKKLVSKAVQREVKDKVEAQASKAVRDRMVRDITTRKSRGFRSAGQLAGTMGASIAQNTGSTFVDVYEETGIMAPDVALAAGVMSGALDALAPLKIAKKIMPNKVFTQFKDKMADNLVNSGGVVKRALVEGFKIAGLEGPTEAMQELIQASAVGMMKNDPNGGFQEYYDEFISNASGEDEELNTRLINAFLVGALGGGTIGSVTGAVSPQTKAPAKGKNNLEQPPAGPDDTPPPAGPDGTPPPVGPDGSAPDAAPDLDNEETLGLPLLEDEDIDLKLRDARERQKQTREKLQGLGGAERQGLSPKEALDAQREQEAKTGAIDLEAPKKYVLSKAYENTAPEISLNNLDLEKSGLEEADFPAGTKVRLLETRGRNRDGRLVGTVQIRNKDFIDTFEVFFNEPTPTRQGLSPEEALLRQREQEAEGGFDRALPPEQREQEQREDADLEAKLADARARQKAAREKVGGLSGSPQASPNEDAELSELERKVASAQERRKAAIENLQDDLDGGKRRGVTPEEQLAKIREDEQRAREVANDAKFDMNLRRTAKAQKLLEQLIPPSMGETGRSTPEENQAANRATEKEAAESGEPILLGPDRFLKDLVGQTVDYGGIEGVLTKRDNGYFVVTADQDVLVESGENSETTTAGELGVRPVEVEVDVPQKLATYNPEDNSLTLSYEQKDKSFKEVKLTYVSTDFDDEGKAVSVSATTQDGANRKIKSDRMVAAIESARAESQLQVTSSNRASEVQIENLPPKVALAVIDGREASGEDSGSSVVSEAEANAAISSLSPADQADLAKRTLALFAESELVDTPVQTTFTDKDEWREFNGKTIGAGEATLEERQAVLDDLAGQPVKQNNGEDVITMPSTGIEQIAERIARAMRRSIQMGNPLSGEIEEFAGIDSITKMGGDTAVALTEIQHAFFDLIESGMPVELIEQMEAMSVHTSSLDTVLKGADGAAVKRGMSLDIGVVGASREMSGASALRWIMAHEGWHILDLNSSISSAIPAFNSEVIVGADGLTLRAGAVVNELYENYLQGTALGKVFQYPFALIEDQAQASIYGTDSDGFNSDFESIGNTIRQEVFAQLGAIYLSDPKLLKSQAPQAYEIIRTIRDNPTLNEDFSNDNANQTGQAEAQPESAGVQGQVRTPPVSGSNEVEDNGGSGDNGGSSPETGQAAQGLVGETQQGDGDSDGRVVREETEGVTPPVAPVVSEQQPLFTPTSVERLREIDPSFNQAKVRSLAQLDERIPTEERIAGRYVSGEPLVTNSGGQFSDLDLTARGEGLDITQAQLEDIFSEAIRLTDTNADGQIGDLAQKTIERLGINPNTVEFWDRSLRLTDNARYWYEVSAEAMRKVLPDLSDAEIKQFISVVAATSPVANPFVNMHRALASFSNHLQGNPIDNDLVIQKSVTDALKTSDLEGLKTGSFGGTMQLVLGMNKPTLSTNDRQVAATFNTDGEAIGKNPELYEVMSRFYIGMRDVLNAKLPEGAQPYETWQLQALGWVEQRYKNEFLKDKKTEGVKEEDALALYEAASPAERASGANDVDDYSMSLLRRDSTGGQPRKGAIQVLEEAGISVPNDKITKEILLDPQVPAALSPTTAGFKEKRIITAEINSQRNPIGQSSRAIYDAAVEQGNDKVANEYAKIFGTLLNKASKGETNPFTLYFSALGLPEAAAKTTRVAMPTGGVPLAVGGTYKGDVSPNIRVPVPASITSDQLDILMTSLSKQWDQDAIPASHVIDMTGGLREGYTETSQVFVSTLEPLSKEQIESFYAALPEGAEINFTRYPNGYEFNVLMFDADSNPITADMDQVALAAGQMLKISDSSITNVSTKEAQFTPAGYSQIENYDKLFASFKESLYTARAKDEIGKIQRKKDGRLKDLTEKQIVAALRRKSPPSDLAGQGSARIQRAHGAIQQQLSSFKQAEQVAKSLAESRDTKLKLFVQKNAKKVGVTLPDNKTDAAPVEKPLLMKSGDDSNVSDLSARREMNNLKEFRRGFMGGLQDKIQQSKEFNKAAEADGLFGSFEKGMRYVATQKNSDGKTVSFKSEILLLSMNRVSALDRSGKYSPFGAIPADKIIKGPDGKDHTATVWTKTINPNGEESTSTASLWKLERQLADGNLKFMGGLRGVPAQSDKPLFMKRSGETRKIEAGDTEGLTRRKFLNRIAAAAVLGGAGAYSVTPSLTSGPLVRGKAKPLDQFINNPLSEASLDALRNNDLISAIDIALEGAPAEILQLAEDIKKTLPKQSTYTTGVEMGIWNVAGVVNPEDRTLKIMPESDGNLATLLHEAMHMSVASRYLSLSTATSRNFDTVKISQPQAREAIDQFYSIWKEFGKAIDAKRANGEEITFAEETAAADPDELFARSLTSPEFQESLYAMNYQGKTLLERFKDWVKQYLFASEGTTPTWLDAALTGSRDILNASDTDSANFDFTAAISAKIKEGKARANQKPLFMKRPSGQTQSYEDALETRTLLNGEPTSNEITLDDETRIEASIRKLQDKYLTLKKFQVKAAEFLGINELPPELDAYMGEELMSGKLKSDFDGLESDFVKPIGDILRANDMDVDDAGLYLMAKHARERNAYIASINKSMPDGGSGLTNEQADQVLNAAREDGTLEAKEEIAEIVYDMLQKNRDRMAESGLLDEGTVDSWNENYDYYVPLKGFAATQDEDGRFIAARGISKGFNVSGKEAMAALGRESQSDNPLLFSLFDVENKMVRARRNEVGQRFLTMAEAVSAAGSKQFTVFRDGDMPTERFTDPASGEVGLRAMTAESIRSKMRDDTGDKQYMGVKVDGKEVFIEIKHAGLNRAMHNVGADSFDNLAGLLDKGVGFLQKFQNFRRNMLINYNPSWMVINPLRDVQTGIMYNLAEESKEGGRVFGENMTAEILANYLPTGKAYFQNARGNSSGNPELDAFYKEYQEAGAATGLTLTRDIDEQKRRLASMISDGSIKNGIRSLGKLVEDLNASSENVIRFATFVAARRNDVTLEKAASLAKNLTVNFTRKGELSSGVNLMYLFFNAAVQGTANIAQAMSGRSASGGPTKAQIAVASMTLISYLVTEHNLMASEEDDDGASVYDDLSDYDKLMSWNIVKADGKSFHQIPMPYGYGFFHTIGRLGAEYANESIDFGDVLATTTAAFAHHMLPPPLGFVGAIGKSDDAMDFVSRAAVDLAPDIVEPVLALAVNKNHFGSPIYLESNPLMTPAPDSSKSKRSTEKIYKDLAQIMNDASGGSLYRTGDVDVSPDAMKYAVEYLSGGVGRFVSRSMDVSYKLGNDVPADDVPLGEYPIARYFNGEPSHYNDQMEYYENIGDAQQIFLENKEISGPEKVLFAKQNAPVIKLETQYKSVQKQLRALRKQKKLIEKNQTNPVRAYELITQIEEKMQLLFDQFNKNYRAATK